MTKEAPMTECPNDAAATASVMPRLTITRCVRESFVLRHSFVIGHWAFVICNLCAYAPMTECPNAAAATAAVMPRLTITRCVRESFVLCHSFVIGHWAFVICNLSAHAAGGGELRLAAAPYLGKDEMKLIRLLPNGFGGFSQLWNGANDHSDKKLRLSGLFFAGSNLVLELLLRNRVIRFTVVGTHTRACSDDLRYQPLRHFVYRDALRKINDLLTKQSGALLQVIRLFIRRAHRSFGLRHSFVIGHSSFVIFNPCAP
jgi:hypothetical protein